jgi:hypothetical protein
MKTKCDSKFPNFRKEIMLKGIRHDLRVVKEMVIFGNCRKLVRRETGLCLREARVLKD